MIQALNLQLKLSTIKLLATLINDEIIDANKVFTSSSSFVIFIGLTFLRQQSMVILHLYCLLLQTGWHVFSINSI